MGSPTDEAWKAWTDACRTAQPNATPSLHDAYMAGWKAHEASPPVGGERARKSKSKLIALCARLVRIFPADHEPDHLIPREPVMRVAMELKNFADALAGEPATPPTDEHRVCPLCHCQAPVMENGACFCPNGHEVVSANPESCSHPRRAPHGALVEYCPDCRLAAPELPAPGESGRAVLADDEPDPAPVEERSEPPPGYEVPEPRVSADGYESCPKFIVHGPQRATVREAIADAWAHHDAVLASAPNVAHEREDAAAEAAYKTRAFFAELAGLGHRHVELGDWIKAQVASAPNVVEPQDGFEERAREMDKEAAGAMENGSNGGAQWFKGRAYAYRESAALFRARLVAARVPTELRHDVGNCQGCGSTTSSFVCDGPLCDTCAPQRGAAPPDEATADEKALELARTLVTTSGIHEDYQLVASELLRVSGASAREPQRVQPNGDEVHLSMTRGTSGRLWLFVGNNEDGHTQVLASRVSEYLKANSPAEPTPLPEPRTDTELPEGALWKGDKLIWGDLVFEPWQGNVRTHTGTKYLGDWTRDYLNCALAILSRTTGDE